MTRKLLIFAAATFLGMGVATAQERLGAGRVEIGAVPLGGMYFMESTNATEPKFGNFVYGGSVMGNVNRWIGLEADFAYAAGVKQDLAVTSDLGPVSFVNKKTPNMLNYGGNILYNPGGSDRPFVPYIAAGVGGMTILNAPHTEVLGVTKDVNYLTANVGGGMRWFAARHWGLRGDYRLLGVMHKSTAPAFFGQFETRYGHRVSGALVLTF